jgi:N-acetylglucosamine-6-phosphate deacetylase
MIVEAVGMSFCCPSYVTSERDGYVLFSAVWSVAMKVIGRRYDTGDAVVVEVANREIVSIEKIAATSPLAWLAPGFVDLQVNGYHGQEFNAPDLTIEQVLKVCRDMDVDGVTSFVPTSTTHSFLRQSEAMRTLAKACDQLPEVAHRVPGFHLEGPYISAADGPRGAHPLEHVRTPNWDEFARIQETAGGRIRILTMSPEYEGSPAFIKRVVDSGVLVAIGHTSAASDQIKAAVDAGARMSTHLGNGAHGQIRRHPNYIWDQVAEDRLTASLIVDGHHLPPSVVKSFIRGKTQERCVLVSDLVGMAGMPPGRYPHTSVGDIEILDSGCIVVGGQRQYLAGAGFPITFGIANVMRFAQIDLKTAVEMASRWPAALIGGETAGLKIGATANLVLFDLPTDDRGPIQIRATINSGDLVYGSLATAESVSAA